MLQTLSTLDDVQGMYGWFEKMPLSRMETSVALPLIIEQLPNLRVVRTESPQLFEGSFLFGFRKLPIEFDVVS